MIDALLPCPFCGSADIDAEFWRSTKTAGPGCMTCGGSAETVAIWNRRAQSDAPAPPHEHKRDISKDRGDDIFCACGEQLPRVTPLPADAPTFTLPRDSDALIAHIHAAEDAAAPARDAPYEMQGRKDYEPIKQYEIGPLPAPARDALASTTCSRLGETDEPCRATQSDAAPAHPRLATPAPDERNRQPFAPARDALVEDADSHWLRCWGNDEMARGNVSNAQRFIEIADRIEREASAALAQRDVPRAEPVAHLWQHSETGRVYYQGPQDDPPQRSYQCVGPLFLYAVPPARDALVDRRKKRNHAVNALESALRDEWQAGYAAALAQRDVPREPTTDMIDAMYHVFNASDDAEAWDRNTLDRFLSSLYRAAYDAAPPERSAAQRGFRLMPSNETLRRQIENDPDDDPSAGDFECTR
jgi:hypothetical protein